MTRQTPKQAILRISPEGNSLTLDGEEFPYDIAAEQIIVSQAANGLSAITVTLLVESATVDADLSPKSSVTEVVQDANGWPVFKEAALGKMLLLTLTTPEPPQWVTALKDIDSDETGVLLYLVRCEDDSWAWGCTADDQSTSGDPWSDFVEAWDGLNLRVERVS